MRRGAPADAPCARRSSCASPTSARLGRWPGGRRGRRASGAAPGASTRRGGAGAERLGTTVDEAEDVLLGHAAGDSRSVICADVDVVLLGNAAHERRRLLRDRRDCVGPRAQWQLVQRVHQARLVAGAPKRRSSSGGPEPRRLAAGVRWRRLAGGWRTIGTCSRCTRCTLHPPPRPSPAAPIVATTLLTGTVSPSLTDLESACRQPATGSRRRPCRSKSRKAARRDRRCRRPS